MSSWQTEFSEACANHSAGRLQDAERGYRRLIQHGVGVGKVSGLLAVLCFQSGRAREAIELFEQALKVDPRDEEAYSNFALALTKMNDNHRAIAVLKAGLQRFPSSVKMHGNLGWLCVLTQDYDGAIVHNRAVVAKDQLAHKAYAHLATAYWKKGDLEQAIAHGKLSLAAKDEVCSRAYRPPQNLHAGEISPLRKAGPTDAPRVIAFSLWGALRTYTEGAICNAELVSEIYPDWVCRFYCDQSVPETIRSRLESLGSQVYLMDGASKGFTGSFWRFFVADDPKVERFLCRDCDSRLNKQEKAGVDEWIASGKPFHIMRDAIVHCDLILAGMWGGVTGKLPSMQGLVRMGVTEGKWADQDFLAAQIWPVIKDQALTHDTYYGFHGGRPFPAGSILDRPYHVGAGYILAD